LFLADAYSPELAATAAFVLNEQEKATRMPNQQGCVTSSQLVDSLAFQECEADESLTDVMVSHSQ
jgi:hypothetical protein